MSLSNANRALQLVSRLLDVRTATEPALELPPQKPALPMGPVSVPLPEAVPESLGVSSRRIAEFLQTLADDPTLHMHSVLVLRRGTVLCRATFGPQRLDVPKQTYSACKSVTALAVGLAMEDGLLAPSDRVVELLPDCCGAVSRQMLKSLTVEHLLSMTASVLFNEATAMTSDDWVRDYLASPGVGEQGKKFQYNSLNTYLLAAIVTRVTGRSLTDYLTERLFAPMGIRDFYWETCPAGIEKGGWGLYLKPEELAKLAVLVQNLGMWDGKRLLSPEFCNTAVQTWAETPESCGDFNYGWQMWVGRSNSSFLFNGMLGQNALCYRHNGILLVSHAGNSESFQQSRYFDHAARFFGGSFPVTLERDPAGERLLKKTLWALSDTAAPLPEREDHGPFAGTRFTVQDPAAASAGLLPLVLQAVHNCYTCGLQAITVAGTRTAPEILYEERDQIYHLYPGVRQPAMQELTVRGNVYRICSQVRFGRNEDGEPVMTLQVDFLETPCSRTVKLILARSGPMLRQRETPGYEFLWQLLEQATQAPALRSVVGTLLGSADPDYPQWKIRRIFEHDLKLEAEL